MNDKLMMQYNWQKLLQDFAVTGLCFDSRKVKFGDAFFAIKGKSVNGNKFINEALSQGAQITITDETTDFTNLNIVNQDKVIIVDNVRIALSQAASIFYPKVPEFMIAITGTNGKTSVTSYCQQLYSLLGVTSASIGTIGIEYSNNIELPPTIYEILDSVTPLTTPDPISFRTILHNLTENNVKYVAFEASSHGLDQERLHDIKVTAACFTSFSQDHLDYHQTMDNYLLAKLKLFTDNLLPTSIVVLNSAIKQLDYIKNYLQERSIRFITVGMCGDLRINKTLQSIYGQEVNFTFKGQEYNFSTKIIGSFQASNLLMAAVLVHQTGFAFEEIIAKLSKVKAVKGRLERVTDRDSIYHIFLDYAHNSDALAKTLNALKKIKLNNGKLKVIFGCGGNRYNGRRILMGQVAAKIADEIIITDDSPRHEDPSLIRQQIITGIDRFSDNKYIEISDRSEAISTTINNLQRDDILLIAGKGHEDYQIIGDRKIPFSEVKIAQEAIKNLPHNLLLKSFL